MYQYRLTATVFEITDSDGNIVLRQRGGMMPVPRDARLIVSCLNAFHAVKDPIKCVEHCRNMAINAEVGPDPRMKGMTDCYLVPLDDMEGLREAVLV